MFSKMFKNRRFRMGSFATVFTIVFVAVIVVLNMLVLAISDRYPIQVDLTTNKIYALSDETIDYLKSLEKDVSIYVLATEENFSSPNDYFLQARETIKKFPQYSGKIKLEFVDLTKNPTFESKYSDYSFAARDILIDCGGRVQIVGTSSLFNLQLDSGTGYSYIKSSRTDEAITSAIMNVTSDYTPKVTILSAHATYDASAFSSLLGQNSFEVITQDLLLEEIDPEAEVAVLFAPGEDLDQAQLRKLDAFLDNDGNKGKTLLYFAAASQPALPNLEEFLAEWGISVEDSTVYESDYRRIYNYNPFYSIADFVNTEIYPDSSAYLLMPNARVMDTLFNERDGKTVNVLLKFGSTAKAIPNDADDSFSIEDAETYAFAAAVHAQTEKFIGNEPVHSNVVAFSSAMSCDSNLLSGTTFANGKYYIALINSMVGREVSFSVTEKTLDTTTLTLTQFQILSIGATFAIIIPVIILIAGIVIWLRRRHK